MTGAMTSGRVGLTAGGMAPGVATTGATTAMSGICVAVILTKPAVVGVAENA